MQTSQFRIPAWRALLAASAAAFLLSAALPAASVATPPKVGDVAPNFSLLTLDDRPVDFGQFVEKGPVVLVELRGWPGYQCPICTQQVRDFVVNAAEFSRRGVRVLMVYPGPAEGLKLRAREFLENKQWPAEFTLVLDPNYAFTHAYGLRWDAKNETAYPSTFIIGADRKISFAKVSKTHGDRVSAAKVLAELR